LIDSSLKTLKIEIALLPINNIRGEKTVIKRIFEKPPRTTMLVKYERNNFDNSMKFNRKSPRLLSALDKIRS